MKTLSSIAKIAAVVFGGLWTLVAVLYGSAGCIGILFAVFGSSAGLVQKLYLSIPVFTFLACLWLLPLFLILRRDLSRYIKGSLAAIWLIQFALASVGLAGGKKYGPEIATMIMSRFPPRSMESN